VKAVALGNDLAAKLVLTPITDVADDGLVAFDPLHAHVVALEPQWRAPVEPGRDQVLATSVWP
jgi:hypothetical protein